MTHLFICDGDDCGTRADAGTTTGGMPRGWTWVPYALPRQPGDNGKHLCNTCAGAAALRRVEAETKRAREAHGEYDLTRSAGAELDTEQARTRADKAPASQRDLF